MHPYTLKTLTVRKLHRHLEDGIFAIPRLQREFVWNGRKAAALLDSIHRQMPIGSIMVWDTERMNRPLLRTSLHVLPPFHDHNSRIWFLIDGQQRLSVLHQITAGETKYNGDGREVDFSRICFRVTKPDDNEAALFEYRKPLDGQFVSVRDVLHPRWQNRLRQLTKSKLERVAHCRDALLGYRVPLIFVQTKDLGEVRDLFIRINSLGTPIASADRAFAKASSLDLREMAYETREQLPPAFRELPYETILQAFAFVSESEGTDVGERAYDAAIRRWERRIERDESERERLKKTWNRLTAAVGKAVDYLRGSFCVLNEALLPSDNMVATLAVFFYVHPGQPSASQRREIAKWFWATGVCQRYSGRGFRENIQRDIKSFRRLASKRKARFSLGELADRDDLLRADYSRRSSLTNAFACLLALNGPRYLTNGEPIPLDEFATRANRKNRHHIFPRALMANLGLSYRQYNSICNICLLTVQENTSIGYRRPNCYLADLKRGRHFARAMRSHLIPCDKASGIWIAGPKRGFKVFLRQRRNAICRAFEDRAGTRLFKRVDRK